MQIMPNHLHGIIVIHEGGAVPRDHPYPGIKTTQENGRAPVFVRDYAGRQRPAPTQYLSFSDVIE